MMRKIILLVLFFAAVVMTGCAPQTGGSMENGKILYKVTDSTGTELSFYARPQRIVSLNVSADEILLDLVDNKRLAALSALADDAGICAAGEKVKNVPRRVYGGNLEGILICQPDLVITPDYDSNTINALRSAGLKTYVYKTPSDVQGIYRLIKELGGAVGDPEAGATMAASLEQRLEKLRAEVNAKVPADERVKVIALSFNGPLGMKGTFSDLCYYAGLRNALENINIPFQSELSEEKMLELNPDMIITPSWDYSKKGDPEMFRKKILTNPTYRNISAVKNNRVVRVHDNYLYCTSQYVALAAEELAAKAYPQYFAAEDDK